MEVYNESNYKREPLSIGQWILTIFLLAIPVINIIMLFVWAFGGNKDERENFAKASLIWMILGFLIVVCFVGCVGFATLGTLLSGF